MSAKKCHRITTDGTLHLGAEWIVALLLVVACCVLTLSHPGIQKYMTTSDQFGVPSFVEDMLRNPHFTPFTWIIPRAPFAFPDLPAYLLVRVLTGNAVVAIVIYSILYVLALIIGGQLVLSRAFPDSNQARLAGLIFISLSILALASSSILSGGEILFWPFISLGHGTAVVTALALFRLYKSILEKPTLRAHLITFILCTAAIFADKLFLIFFCGPYAVVLFASSFTKGGRSRLIVFVIEMAVAFAISTWFERLFVQQYMGPIDFKLLGRLSTIAQLVATYGIGPWLWLLVEAAAAVVLVWPAGPLKRVAAREPGPRRAQLFVAALTVFGLGVGILLWSVPILILSRYLVGFEIGGLLAVTIVATSLVPVARHARQTLVVLILVTTVVGLGSAHLVNPFLPLAKRKTLAKTFATCQARLGLRSGFADYWIARHVSMETNWRIQINQLIPGTPSLFFWGNNLLWYYYNRVSGNPLRPNFIIDNNINRVDIERFYGKPQREGDCGKYHVLIYDNSLRLRALSLETLFGWGWTKKIALHLPKSAQAPKAKEYSPINLRTLAHLTGSIIDGVAVARAPADRAGFLLYGPYATMAPNSYAVDIYFACTDNERPNVFDVAAYVRGETLARTEIGAHDARCNGQDQLTTLKFDLSKITSQIQFRVIFGGSGTLEVKRLVLRHRGEMLADRKADE